MNNTQVLLANRPLGLPKATDFSLATRPVRPLAHNEVLVRNQYIAIDPAMRSWIAGGRSYINSVPVGGLMRGLGTGVVIESKHPNFRVGDHIHGGLCVQEYALMDEQLVNQGTHGSKPYLIDPHVAPQPAYLSTLGIPGMTAYFGLLRVGRIQAGETVVVSAAAGGVGSVAGQIAKRHGCRVVGLTSTPEKSDEVVKRFGFDACIAYKSPGWRDELAALCPDGIHVYFDNVGGDILNVVLPLLAQGGRVVLSGAVSQYNNMQFMRGPATYLTLISNRASMQGFVAFDYINEFADARAELQQWIQEGSLKPGHQVVPTRVGDFVDVLHQLFNGQHVGKLIMEVVID